MLLKWVEMHILRLLHCHFTASGSEWLNCNIKSEIVLMSGKIEAKIDTSCVKHDKQKYTVGMTHAAQWSQTFPCLPLVGKLRQGDRQQVVGLGFIVVLSTLAAGVVQL